MQTVEEKYVRTLSSSSSEDDDYNPFENGDHRVQREKGIGKRHSRWSAQEAAKKRKKHFTTSSDEDDGAHN